TGYTDPAKPACRRYLSGRPAVLPASLDCPITATERGKNSARRNLSASPPSARGRPARIAPSAARTRISLRRIGPLSPLIEPAVEDLLRNAVLENFHRAAGDHPAAAATHAVFHQGLAAVAGRAHGLHGLVSHLKPGEIAGRLGDRGLIGGRKAAVGVGGG